MDEKESNLWFLDFSTNRQLAELAGEIGLILRHDERYSIREKLRAKGPGEYGALGGWTYTIKMLFDWIRDDPKNEYLLDWLNERERELRSYLYGEAETVTTENIQAFIDASIQKYIEEIE